MFGSTSGFGSNTNSFGSPSNTGFGFNSNNTSSPFGNTSSGFGNNNTSTPFGGTSNSGFGTTNSSGFGSLNNNNNNSAFGGFGSTNNNNTSSPFGFNNNNTSNSTFGNNNNSMQSDNLPGTGTGNVTYQRTKSGTEDRLTYHYIAITAMPQFQGTNSKTIEELRLMDYGVSGGGNNSFFGGSSTMFNQNNTNNSMFGNTNSSNNTFGNNNNNSGGMFGNNNNSTFGSNNNSTFGNTSSGFGNNNSGGVFGNTNNNTGFGNFNSSGSVFGNNNTKSTFGQTSNTFGSTNNNTSGGLFGSSTNNSNNLFGNNNNNNTGFGSSNNNSGGGLFGNNNNNNSGGGLFGSTNNNNNSGGLFGNNTSSSGSGGLFGNSSNNNNSSGGLFGNNNNNSTSLFGNSNKKNASSGLFGSNNNNSGGLFGNNSNTSGGVFGNSSSGLFGNSNNNSLFGNKTTTSSNLFGGNSNNSGNSFFNNNTNNASNGQGNEVLQLMNLAGFAKNNNVEMKRQLDLAKRAWNPSSSLSNSGDYGPKKFKFQVGTTDSKAESDPLELKNKFDEFGPKALKRSRVQSMGALVVRSASKQQTKAKRLLSSGGQSQLTLLSTSKVLKLTDKFKIDKSKRKVLPALENKHITLTVREEEKVPEPPAEKLLFVVKDPQDEVKSINSNAPTISDKLISEGYRTKPDIEALKRMSDQELSQVENFAIIRVNFGSVEFPGQVDIRNLELSESIVEITDDSVEIYKTEEDTPPVGQGLNRRAEITIQNVTIPLGFVGGIEEFRKFLQNVYTPKIGATFLSFNLDEENADKKCGTWKFQVEHFTKYAFDESSFVPSPVAEQQTVRISPSISSFIRNNHLPTNSFWTTSKNCVLALQMLSLNRKFLDDFDEVATLQTSFSLLRYHTQLASKFDSKFYEAIFQLLIAALLKPLELLEHSTANSTDLTLEVIVKILSSEYVESVAKWYQIYGIYFTTSDLTSFFEKYEHSRSLLICLNEFSHSQNIFIQILRVLVFSKKISVKELDVFYTNSVHPDIVLYQLFEFLGILGFVPRSFAVKRDIGISIVSNFIASIHLQSDEESYEMFLACLWLVDELKFSPLQFLYLLNSYFNKKGRLCNSSTVLAQIEVVAHNIGAETQFEEFSRTLKNEKTFLKFKSEKELDYILRLPLSDSNFKVFEVLILKAISVAVYDKRPQVSSTVITLLEVAYAKGFTLGKDVNKDLFKIKELFLHLRKLYQTIVKNLQNTGISSTNKKLNIDTYQKLYVLYNELQLDVSEYREKNQEVGITFVSYIEKESEKSMRVFRPIFQGLFNVLEVNDRSLHVEVEKINFNMVSEIFS